MTSTAKRRRRGGEGAASDWLLQQLELSLTRSELPLLAQAFAACRAHGLRAAVRGPGSIYAGNVRYLIASLRVFAMTRTVNFEPLQWPRRMLAWTFVACGLWYLGWRAGTLNAEVPVFSALIYGAECFGFLSAALHIFMCWRLTVRKAPAAQPGVTVDVFIPTYNENVALVRKTVLAVRAMDYAHETWLLDDGRRPEMARLAAELGVRYLARPDNADAKAGNLNHALAHSQGELVVVFDADHAPRRDFLTKTVGYFVDHSVAFVQTPQDFYNLDSYQHRWQRGKTRTVWTEQSLFFRVIQRGKDYWNAAFFCGSCAVVRRESLDAIGGFATGTITEDLHTSIRLHAKGYKSVYHAEPLAFGLAPEAIEPFLSQRIRWGQGAMHVWRMEGLLTHRGLSWAQRVNYLASVLTYFDGWTKGLFYLAPAIVLLSGTMPIVTSTPDFLLHFVPYCLLTLWVFEEVGRGYGRTLFIEQYNMARFAAFAWATLAWVLPRRWLKFKVTSKGALANSPARFMLPQAMVLGVNLLAVPLGLWFYSLWGHLPLDGVIANVLWASVNAALALAVLVFTSRTTAFMRGQYRFPVPLPAVLSVRGSAPMPGTVDDISERGLRFYGPLPSDVAPGDIVSGKLMLPDDAMSFHGEVRSLERRPEGDSEGEVRAVGCRFEAEPADLHRLETFLFGSDLQWTLNSLTDQIHTPLSWLWPARVAGPKLSPLADRQWNGAALSDPRLRIETASTALVSSPTAENPTSLVLSFLHLPTERNLVLTVSQRRPEQPRAVRLYPATLPGAPPGVHLYVVGEPVASPPSLPRPPRVAKLPTKRDFQPTDFADSAM